MFNGSGACSTRFHYRCSSSSLIAMLLSALIITAPGTAVHGSEPPDSTMTKSTPSSWMENTDAQWLWPAASGSGPNQYVQLIQDFNSRPGSGAITLGISADTNYAAWLNGTLVGFGQWRNYPDDKTYDTLDVTSATIPGKNRLCLEVYYQGEDSSTYRKGKPGAIFAVRDDQGIITTSGLSTLSRQAPNYVSGPVPKVTGQLGYTFEHRGDKEDGWRKPDYIPDTSWAATTAADLSPLSSRPIRPRPVEKLLLEPRLPMRIASQGSFTRTKPDTSPAVAMQTDALTYIYDGELFKNSRPQLSAGQTTGIAFNSSAWKDATGPFIVLDIGHEEAGVFDLEVDAPAGTVIDIGYGEHLEDLRVRTSVGGRNFAVRHTCGEGHQQFLHPYLRFAGRYIQLQITPVSASYDKPIILKYAGLRPTPYPVDRVGSFNSSDSLHNRINEVSRRTLELCMHEHYEDCPWREQALYAMDGRNQALAGYYCFGNYDFAAASIKLLGQGLDPADGLLELCAPARVSVTIPSFSLAWILMLDDHYLFRGDKAFVQSQLPVARQLIDTFNGLTSGPLLINPVGQRMWNFYEWAPGLDGAGNRGIEHVKDSSIDAPLNLFYILSLDALARLTRECGGDPAPYEKKAADVRKVFADAFWDATEKAFRTRLDKGNQPHFAELTQALAILANVVPETELHALRARLAADENGLTPCTISHTLYKFEALLTDSEKYAARVFELILRDWGYMLSQGATSFWETIDGAKAFNNAGSLCHGWSGVPSWFYGAYILGIKPTAPGFTSYEVKPVHGVVNHVEGTVPTPNGSLTIKWNEIDGKIKPEVSERQSSPQN